MYIYICVCVYVNVAQEHIVKQTNTHTHTPTHTHTHTHTHTLTHTHTHTLTHTHTHTQTNKQTHFFLAVSAHISGFVTKLIISDTSKRHRSGQQLVLRETVIASVIIVRLTFRKGSTSGCPGCGPLCG